MERIEFQPTFPKRVAEIDKISLEGQTLTEMTNCKSKIF